MAKKKDTQEQPAESAPVSAAKSKAKGAGKTAPAAEPAPAERPQTKSVKVPKLAKKNKSRLPRRQKKAQQKAAGRK